MNIRDLAALDITSRLDEVIEVCKPGGSVSTKCPQLAADVTRKAMAMKGSVARLRTALDEAGPPPSFPKSKAALYMRIDEPEVREIASLVGHYGVLEDDLFTLTKELAGKYGNDRTSDAIKELVWIDRNTRWARLRPEVIPVCRPLIGPVPGAEGYERWWRDRSGPPEPRSPELAQQKRQAREEPRPEEKPAKKRTPITTDVTPEQAAREAKGKNKTGLLAMFRKARKDLKEYGEGTWGGKKAMRRLAAAEAELKARGIDLPPED